MAHSGSKTRRTTKGALWLLIAAGTACRAEAAQIHIAQGVIAGTTSNGVESFLGIPYGAPPTGENRWRAPRPAASWRGTRSAISAGPACPQALSKGFGPYTLEYLVQGAVSEDCLSLNVWRPAGIHASDNGLPVMVWIHGGGFAGGSGAVLVYNGAGIARQGVIVVTINYRLGVFGFLAHPELSLSEGPSGNYGIQDMMLALRWVKQNARALGGDASRVTLAGQSAGSMAIHDLMVSPAARGLFQQVISESGPGIGYPPRPLADAEATGQALLKAAGVPSIERLRQLPVAKIEEAADSLKVGLFGFAPVVDGRVIPLDPARSIAGTFADTPVLAGMNADEASQSPHDGAAYRTQHRERGLASTYRWVRSRSVSSRQPIYLYIFEHVEPGSEPWGAFHSSEIPYVLANLDAAPTRRFTEHDRVISRNVSAYWVNFIKTGNPNSPELPVWPKYDNARPDVMELGGTLRSVPLLDAEKRAFYDAYTEAGGTLSLF